MSEFSNGDDLTCRYLLFSVIRIPDNNLINQWLTRSDKELGVHHSDGLTPY